MILLTTTLILIHSWYPLECCEGTHCHPVPCAEIKSDGDYWDWENFIWRKVDARLSQDGLCHVCTAGSNALCLFLGATS